MTDPFQPVKNQKNWYFFDNITDNPSSNHFGIKCSHEQKQISIYLKRSQI